MMRFEIDSTSIDGLRIIHQLPISDSRGFFVRFFCNEQLGEIIGHRSILQINRSLTTHAGFLRGLHFQHPPHEEMKLVSCLRGKVFDVAVDLRKGSSTFMNWHAEVLSESNNKIFVIPEGFAHGFQALTDNCELLYLHTSFYAPEAEGGLNALDPKLGIEWPLPVNGRSERDLKYAPISNDFYGLSL